MKKFTFKIFTLFSSLLVITSCAAATGRPMNKKEHETFIKTISKIITTTADKQKKKLRSRCEEVLEQYLISFETDNDAFDSTYMTQKSTAGDYMEACYQHISDGLLSTQGFCCRGLSAYVLKYLMDNEFDYKYIQFLSYAYKLLPNPSSMSMDEKNSFIEPHIAVKYTVGEKSYVCDFTQALAGCIIEKYGSPFLKFRNTKRYNGHSWEYCLAFPLEEYKTCFKYRDTEIRIDPDDGKTYLDIDWTEREVDKSWPWTELRDHPSRPLPIDTTHEV